MYIDFNIILEMLRREMHDNMVITDKHIAALLDTIEQVNGLNPEILSDDIYDELAKIAGKVDRLMDLRQALYSFHSELRMLGHNPPELPMENPPALEIDVAVPYVRIELDSILPFQTAGGVHYLHEKLDRALSRYGSEHCLPGTLFTERCAVVFIHHYQQTGKAAKEIRDYDNLERRCILNTLAHHFLRDDSPYCCITMDAIAPRERNFTEIRIMPLPHFREYVMSDEIEYIPPVDTSKKNRNIYQKYFGNDPNWI